MAFCKWFFCDVKSGWQLRIRTAQHFGFAGSEICDLHLSHCLAKPCTHNPRSWRIHRIPFSFVTPSTSSNVKIWGEQSGILPSRRSGCLPPSFKFICETIRASSAKAAWLQLLSNMKSATLPGCVRSKMGMAFSVTCFMTSSFVYQPSRFEPGWIITQASVCIRCSQSGSKLFTAWSSCERWRRLLDSQIKSLMWTLSPCDLRWISFSSTGSQLVTTPSFA